VGDQRTPNYPSVLPVNYRYQADNAKLLSGLRGDSQSQLYGGILGGFAVLIAATAHPISSSKGTVA